jgi:hypothetical protein
MTTQPYHAPGDVCPGYEGDQDDPNVPAACKGGHEPSARPVLCDCGAPIDVGGPLEDEHFVFAARRDGSRSNLGYCPVKHGMSKAVSKARWALSGVALYHGKVV